MTVNGKNIAVNTIFDLWLNAHYFHSEPEKRAQLELMPYGDTRFEKGVT